MEKVKTVFLSSSRQIFFLIVGAPFWMLALLDLFLRLFMVRPLGALLAVGANCIWFWYNRKKVGRYFGQLYQRLSSSARTAGAEKTSLWYENEGRDKIARLMNSLSAQGVYYCNLASELSLPPKSHWGAISRGLNALGVATQVSDGAFYIAWKKADEG